MVDELPSDQKRGIPQPPLELPPNPSMPILDLPDPRSLVLPSMDLRTAMERRRTVREYSNDPLSMEELSYLLWCTQGVQAITAEGKTQRNVPSSGGMHAFETYLLARSVAGLEQGIYRFLALEHRIQPFRLGPQTIQEVTHLCADQEKVSLSAVTFIWTAVPYRVEWLYARCSYRALFINAGHVCQNLYLAAEPIGCGVCAIGGFYDDEFNAYMRFASEQQFVIYCAALGRKRAQTDKELFSREGGRCSGNPEAPQGTPQQTVGTR
jgi:SagB-type dehydrogenase family enzyme